MVAVAKPAFSLINLFCTRQSPRLPFSVGSSSTQRRILCAAKHTAMGSDDETNIDDLLGLDKKSRPRALFLYDGGCGV